MIRELSITALVENTTANFDLLGEWGLSLWIEADDHRILYDTGQGKTLLENARALKADLRAADALVLSHGHSDHS
jgi:7,8-dihydropterin-6-yl-methyl-4-(beta-D-ribofuranosyl)aminobenzene 5'-phosphate synthase